VRVRVPLLAWFRCSNDLRGSARRVHERGKAPIVPRLSPGRIWTGDHEACHEADPKGTRPSKRSARSRVDLRGSRLTTDLARRRFLTTLISPQHDQDRRSPCGNLVGRMLCARRAAHGSWPLLGESAHRRINILSRQARASGSDTTSNGANRLDGLQCPIAILPGAEIPEFMSSQLSGATRT